MDNFSNSLFNSLIKSFLFSLFKFGFPPSFLISSDKTLIVSSSFCSVRLDCFSLFFKNSSSCLSLRASTLLTPAAIAD